MTVRLEAGTPLGTVRLTEAVVLTAAQDTDLPTSSTSLVKAIEYMPERMDQLMS